MSSDLQKFLRFITPAVIILAATWLLGKLTGLWDFALPSNLEEWSKSLWGLLLGFLYYVTPTRNIFNKPYFDRVSENIRSNLLKIAGVHDNPGFYTWEKLKPIFWHFVDNDKSLTKKASQAYFNGYFWTSVADCRAIFLIFFVLSFGIIAAGNYRGILSAGVFLAIAIVSLWFSKLLTQRHIAIGDEQLEVIAHFYRKELKDQVDAITA
jgi:hypothetical protein